MTLKRRSEQFISQGMKYIRLVYTSRQLGSLSVKKYKVLIFKLEDFQ